MILYKISNNKLIEEVEAEETPLGYILIDGKEINKLSMSDGTSYYYDNKNDAKDFMLQKITDIKIEAVETINECNKKIKWLLEY